MLHPYEVENLAAMRQEEARQAAAQRRVIAQLPRTAPAWERRARAGLATLLVALAGRFAPDARAARPSACACAC
ncbi:MAG TPA: hypothetical protein VFW96_29330 [Thermomicrobiales bacterium]|nr:hypothetical protein [Thermomicrobiales bacterium]